MIFRKVGFEGVADVGIFGENIEDIFMGLMHEAGHGLGQTNELADEQRKNNGAEAEAGDDDEDVEQNDGFDAAKAEAALEGGHERAQEDGQNASDDERPDDVAEAGQEFAQHQNKLEEHPGEKSPSGTGSGKGQEATLRRGEPGRGGCGSGGKFAHGRVSLRRRRGRVRA